MQKTEDVVVSDARWANGVAVDSHNYAKADFGAYKQFLRTVLGRETRLSAVNHRFRRRVRRPRHHEPDFVEPRLPLRGRRTERLVGLPDRPARLASPGPATGVLTSRC